MKILKLSNFYMLFHLVLTKFFKSELFSCLLKVNHVIKSYKEPTQNSLYLAHRSLDFRLEVVCFLSKISNIPLVVSSIKCYLFQQLPFSEQGIVSI